MARRLVTYVALLRGVNNIGRATRVSMSDLRALFEGLGFRDVRTLLNSGNVVFSAHAGRRVDVLARIEKALASKLELTSRVVLLSAKEVLSAVRENPFSRVATDPSHLLVVALRAPSDLGRLQPLLTERWAPEAFALGRHTAYLWCAKGVAKSPLHAAVDRMLGQTGTARNITTMTKLKAMVEGPPAKPTDAETFVGQVRKTAENIDEYISAFSPEVRTVLRRIRLTIRRNAPEAQELISYRMPAFRSNGILLYFAAFKDHIGLFPPVSGDASLQKALSPYAGPKGNLKFPLDQPIPYGLIQKIVKLRLKQDREKASEKRQKAVK